MSTGMIRFVSLIPNSRERYGDSFSPKLLDRLVARAPKTDIIPPTPHGESEQTGFGHPPNKINNLAGNDLSISPPPPVGRANEKKNAFSLNKNKTLSCHCEEPPNKSTSSSSRLTPNGVRGSGEILPSIHFQDPSTSGAYAPFAQDDNNLYTPTPAHKRERTIDEAFSSIESVRY